MDEAFYHQSSWYSKHDARGHFAYGILDEVLRVALTMQRWKEVIDWWEIQKKEGDPDDGIERLVYESINFEQKLWCRKLSEHLVSVILFSEHNKQSLYRIWMAGRSFEKAVGRYLDLKEYYNCKNGNLRFQIKHLLEDMRHEIKKDTIYADDLFFINDEAKPILLNWGEEKYQSIFNSYEKLFKMALKITNDPTDKLILWPSYDSSYWRFSEVVHANDWVGDPKISLGHIKTEFYLAWMFCARIIIWLYTILWIEKTDWAKQIENMFNSDKLEAHHLIKNTHQKEFDSGDLVFCQNVLAEVVKKQVSKYGNTSYKIQFLWTPPIWEIPVEEMPSRAIQWCVLKKKGAKKYFDTNVIWRILDPKLAKEMESISTEIDNENAYTILKKVFIDIDKTLKDNGGIIRIYAS